MLAAGQGDATWVWTTVAGAVMFAASGATVWFGWPPLQALLLRRETQYDRILRGRLLLNLAPRTMTYLSVGMVGVSRRS